MQSIYVLLCRSKQNSQLPWEIATRQHLSIGSSYRTFSTWINLTALNLSFPATDHLFFWYGEKYMWTTCFLSGIVEKMPYVLSRWVNNLLFLSSMVGRMPSFLSGRVNDVCFLYGMVGKLPCFYPYGGIMCCFYPYGRKDALFFIDGWTMCYFYLVWLQRCPFFNVDGRSVNRWLTTLDLRSYPLGRKFALVYL